MMSEARGAAEASADDVSLVAGLVNGAHLFYVVAAGFVVGALLVALASLPGHVAVHAAVGLAAWPHSLARQDVCEEVGAQRACPGGGGEGRRGRRGLRGGEELAPRPLLADLALAERLAADVARAFRSVRGALEVGVGAPQAVVRRALLPGLRRRPPGVAARALVHGGGAPDLTPVRDRRDGDLRPSELKVHEAVLVVVAGGVRDALRGDAPAAAGHNPARCAHEVVLLVRRPDLLRVAVA
mmetsp:Transcript_68403/g.179336  ORF Transcript_68403/g.179336 Transcript_68403/m.179336 type:complete len:241 (-) Transcript_68403:462-1184(-)